MIRTREHEGRWSARLADGRIRCDLCPRRCRLDDGQRAFCFVRQRRGNRIVLTTYGRSTGFCVDPIEKKPLFHFLPGSAALSFGTAGCNLGCQFCQNWHISKSREEDVLAADALPATIADAARRLGCASVAFTYNDPIVFAEYAIDTAEACRQRDVRTVAVTAGYVTPEARADFFGPIDAANVDLKAFDPSFYDRLCLTKPGGLQHVLDTLVWIAHETDVWLELTTLLIPFVNDSDAELRELCGWVARELGPDVPIHFSAFHPDFRMRDRPWTPLETLTRARRIALDCGLHYPYTGNVPDPEGQSTWCPGCGGLLIERDGSRVARYRLDARGLCPDCGRRIAGIFEDSAGSWGSHSQPVHLEPS